MLKSDLKKMDFDENYYYCFADSDFEFDENAFDKDYKKFTDLKSNDARVIYHFQDRGKLDIIRQGWRNQNVDAAADVLNLYPSRHHQRVAVNMDDVVLISLNDDVLTTIDAHVVIMIELAQEQAGTDERTLNHVERVHHGYINQAVLHGGARRNIGVVAILSRIAACDDKGFFL